MKSSSTLLLALALVLSSASCASIGPASNATQGRTTNANTGMTAADLGHRFLAMINSVNDFNALSAGFIQRSTGQKFEGDENSGFHTLKLPDGKWQYGTTYYFDRKLEEYSNVTLELIKASNSVAETRLPCDLLLDEYDHSLKSMGFSVKPSTHNEIGGLLALHYTRKNMHVQIIPQHQAPTCIKAISVQKFEE